MNARPILCGLVTALAGFTCLAAEPYTANYDTASRVRKVEYQDNLVLKAVGYADHPLMLELNPDEPILEVAGGVISNWEVQKKAARLYARPLDDARPTTLMIATKSRSYVLDLVPGKTKGAPSDFVSKIVVTYPAPPEKPKGPDLVAEGKAARDASTPLEEAKKATRNTRYTMEVVSETVDIRPREVFDDGRFTYFRYPQNLPIPAIYKGVPGTEEEWLVNSHRDGDYIVVQGLGQLWNLRLSGSVLGIFNDAYDPMGVAAESGSTIEGVKRELK